MPHPLPLKGRQIAAQIDRFMAGCFGHRGLEYRTSMLGTEIAEERIDRQVLTVFRRIGIATLHEQVFGR